MKYSILNLFSLQQIHPWKQSQCIKYIAELIKLLKNYNVFLQTQIEFPQFSCKRNIYMFHLQFLDDMGNKLVTIKKTLSVFGGATLESRDGEKMEKKKKRKC